MKFKAFFSFILFSVFSQSLICMDSDEDINPFADKTPPRSVVVPKIQKPTPVKNRAVTGLEIAPVVDRIPTPEEEYFFPIEDRDGSESRAVEAATMGSDSRNSSFRRSLTNGSFGSFNGLTPTPVKTPGAPNGRDSVAIAQEILKRKNNRACTPESK